MYKHIALWPFLVVLAACASSIKEGESYVAYDGQEWGKLGTSSGSSIAHERCRQAGLVVGSMENFYGSRNGVRFTCERAANSPSTAAVSAKFQAAAEWGLPWEIAMEMPDNPYAYEPPPPWGLNPKPAADVTGKEWVVSQCENFGWGCPRTLRFLPQGKLEVSEQVSSNLSTDSREIYGRAKNGKWIQRGQFVYLYYEVYYTLEVFGKETPMRKDMHLFATLGATEVIVERNVRQAGQDVRRWLRYKTGR